MKRAVCRRFERKEKKTKERYNKGLWLPLRLVIMKNRLIIRRLNQHKFSSQNEQTTAKVKNYGWRKLSGGQPSIHR